MGNEDGTDNVYSRLTHSLGALSPEYKVEGGVFIGLESVLLLLAIFHVVRECRNKAQFAALYIFIHRMLVCGTLLHIVELAATLHSTHGPLTGYLGNIASNFKQLPSISCLFYFIGVTFEVYQREFLPGRASSIAAAWRVLIVMLLGFIFAIFLSLVLMFYYNKRKYNSITTVWEGVCFAVTFVVVVSATCRLRQAANQRRQSLSRRASTSAPGNPLTPLLRKVAVISVILVGCFLASLMGAYAVFVEDEPFGGTRETVYSEPPPSTIFWDWILLDIMYITIHAVIMALSWRAPRKTHSVEDSEKKSVAWERKSSTSSKPRIPLSPISLNSQHSQDGTTNPGVSNQNSVSHAMNIEEALPPPSPTVSREHSASDYALSG